MKQIFAFLLPCLVYGAPILDGVDGGRMYFDGIQQGTEVDVASITNAMSTNTYLTANLTNGQLVIGSTSTPIFAERDTLALTWIESNGVARSSNNTYASGTLQTLARGFSSNFTMRGQGDVLRAENSDQSAYILLTPTNAINAPSITVRANSSNLRPVLQYLNSGSTMELLLQGGAGEWGISSKRDIGTYGNWGNQLNSSSADTGIGVLPGRAFWVSTAIASSTTGDAWLLMNLDPASSYQNAAITINGGRRFRKFDILSVSNTTICAMNLTNNTVAFSATVTFSDTATSTSNRVDTSTTNLVNVTYTNASGTRWIGYVSVALTNNGTGYAAAGFEVGGRILSQIKMTQSATNIMMLIAPVSAGQSYSITNLSSGGSIGIPNFTQGKE